VVAACFRVVLRRHDTRSRSGRAMACRRAIDAQLGHELYGRRTHSVLFILRVLNREDEECEWTWGIGRCNCWPFSSAESLFDHGVRSLDRLPARAPKIPGETRDRILLRSTREFVPYRVSVGLEELSRTGRIHAQDESGDDPVRIEQR